METQEIIEKKDVRKNYSFAYEQDGMSRVICKCGARFEKKMEQGEKFSDSEVEALDDMKELLMFSVHEKLKCPECGTNFFIEEERSRLIPIGTYFMGGFKFKKNEEGAILSFWRIKALVINDQNVEFKKQERSLEVMNKEGEIWYQPFEYETKMGVRFPVHLDLNNIVSVVKEFLSADPVRTIYDLYEMHLFLIWLAGVTQDAGKMHIVEEIMAPMRGRINDAGFDYVNKALCVFFCILKFPNLSTIALTKGMIFLSDLISECDLPDSASMRAIGATSPLDIFNNLTASYLKRIKNELVLDNNSVKDYVFRPSEHTADISSGGQIVMTEKSSALVKDHYIPQEAPKVVRLQTEVDQQTQDVGVIDSAFASSGTTTGASFLNIRVRDQEKMDRMQKSRLGDVGRGERGGKSGVTDAIEDGTITKYIYDHLRTFSDYKRLVKFFKFYSKGELSDLMKKYEIDYLLHFIDIAYWREKMEDAEFYRLSRILKDFVKIQTKGRRMFFDKKNEEEIDEKDLDYSLMERFDFTIYDDSISMLESLREMTSNEKLIPSEETDMDMFDRSRYFDKIREYKKLKNFHDSLAAQYRLLESSGLEKDSSYHKFVNKYHFLEEESENAGPIKVQLLKTMSDFMREGHLMMSSQAQYGAKVSQGIYLVARLLDTSTDAPPKEAKRFTIGFTVDRFGYLEFDQLKEFKNAQASDRVKALVRGWLKSKNITYDERATDIRFKEISAQ